MKDITDTMNVYRESARALWNNALRPGADFDTVDVFSGICDALFSELILRPFGRDGFRRADSREPYPFLHVMPVADPIPVMVNRPSADRNMYWDDPVDRVGLTGLSMLWIGTFDFDEFGFIDIQYYRVRIARCDEHPHVAGRQALMDVHDVRVLIED